MHIVEGKGGKALVFLAALLCLLPAVPAGAIVCELVDGPPGEEIVLWMEILSPQDGEVFPVYDETCQRPVTITGSYLVETPSSSNDFYLTLDTSGSTTTCSEVDVDGDGITCSETVYDGKDSIYHAELQAAQNLVSLLDGASSSAALLTFDTVPVLHEPLTPDLAQVLATIEALKSGTGLGATEYVPALQMLEDEALANGDFVNRQQWGLFLSDGEPLDGGSPVLNKAQELADLGIRVDTFDLDPDDTALEMLPEIASITGGVFHNLEKPGDIVALLPGLAFSYRFTVRNDSTGEERFVFQDFTTGGFEAEVDLGVGDNHIVFVMETLGSPPLVLECPIDLTLDLPWPEDPGPTLRASKAGLDLEEVDIDWTLAPPRAGYEQFRVFFSPRPQGPHQELVRTTASRVVIPLLAYNRTAFFDVRRTNCAEQVSYDPYPPQTPDAIDCWTSPLIAGYPLASNLTDAACTDRYSSHNCDRSIDLSGVDREFYHQVTRLGRFEVVLSNPDLYVALYDRRNNCVNMGQGRAEAEITEPGVWRVVVDAPPGREGPFDLTMRMLE